MPPDRPGPARCALLTAFQIGDGKVRLDRPYRHDAVLDTYRLRPDRVATLLADAGFAVIARTVRAPAAWERTPQTYLLAQRPE